MARYFEFLSQFYGFHLTRPRNINTDKIEDLVYNSDSEKQYALNVSDTEYRT
jgi:hypothetical protein